MGTKVEANAFSREYHSVIDVDGNTSNEMKPINNENKKPKNDENRNSYALYDPEEVRQTILKHESIFRYQLQELHRLHGRQRELMNEIRREISKGDVKVEKCQSSYLFSLNPCEVAKRPWNPYHSSSMATCYPSSSANVAPSPSAPDKSSLRSCEPRMLNGGYVLGGTYNFGIPADVYSRNMDKQALCNGNNILCLSGVQSSDLYFKRNNNLVTKDFFPDHVDRRKQEKDFFPDHVDRRKQENFQSVLGSRGERSGNDQLCDETRRFDKHSSVGDFFSVKPPPFPLSLLAEQKREFSNSPLDIVASVSRKRKKIFGVEILENDDLFDAASNKSSKLDEKPHGQNHDVFSLESSSWISNSFAQNLDLRGSNLNDGESTRLKADRKAETSSQKRICNSSDTKEKWPESVRVNFIEAPYQHSVKYMENMSMHEEGLKENSEHSRKFTQMISQGNPKGGLPWFLKNSQVRDDVSEEKESSYFMNLNSLQNCSQKFFGKGEKHSGIVQTSKQKEEASAPMAACDVKDKMIDEVNDGTESKKILGFHLNDLKSEEDVSEFSDIGGDCGRKIEINKGLNDYISDLRHGIDLNLSVNEEDATSAPSVPKAIMKIATIEIDLEAPAVIESEMDASPEEVESKKTYISPGKSELPPEECESIAAEAMIAISLSTEKKLVDDDSLKWFVETASSQCGDSLNVLVEVLMNQSREGESVPNGMDYFEFMTLKLEDKGEKHYHYEPFVLSDDEVGPTHNKRSRRGQSRRGRQRKDFQRDILPSLTTLSRLQVKEDFQAFEELLKAKGSTRQSSLSHRSCIRNGRGRKRTGGASKAHCSTLAEQQPIGQVEERSLAGWGKRTRRLPRQRCSNTLLSFPVRC